MALQFIFGSSISRKSEVIFREALQDAEKNPGLLWQIVVPEQSTLVVQKQVLELTRNLGLMQVDVVSFNRLAYRVMEDVNQHGKGILDDTGKSMLLRKIAGEVADSLELFGGNLSRRGFIEQLKSMLSEFLQYGIQSNQLERVIEQLDNQPLLQHKIRDLGKIYQAFKDRKDGNVITAEELLPQLCEWVPDSEYVKRSVFVLDGFTGFTPVQYQLLELLLVWGRDVQVILNMDTRENPYKITGMQELFYMSKQVVSKLSALADKLQVEIKPAVMIEDCRPAAAPLAELERRLFRYPLKAYGEKADAIHLHQAKNPEEEVRYVLLQVLSCIRQGYRYRELAVICSDMNVYTPVIEKWFGRADLPMFLDRKKTLIDNPLVELIRSALEVVEKNYAYESVFALLRSSLIPLNRYEVDCLENYVKALGIYGRKWQQPWDRTYRGMSKDSTEELAVLNVLRQQVLDWLEPLAQIFAEKSNVKEVTRVLYQFLSALTVQEQLAEKAVWFEQEGELLLANEYRQCFDKVLGLLEQFTLLMGEEILSLTAYQEVLEAGFENLQVGLIPPAIDRLVVGDLMRTRLDGVKVLFMLGCNDSLIPAAGEKHGLLSDLDRELLKKVDMELAPTGREDGFSEKYYLYLTMTKPSDHLYLLWSGVSGEGKAMRPCYLVGQLQKLFPKALQTDQDSLSPAERIWQPQESLEVLIEGMRQYQRGSQETWWRDLYSWYRTHEGYEIRLEHALAGMFAAYRQEHLSPAVSARIFGAKPLNSVTRLETFSACAYAHFLTYGLGLSERQEYELDAMDYGNIFHESIETFFRLLREHEANWESISDEERLRFVQESVQKVTEDYGNTILKSSARYRYLVGRLERMTDKTIWALTRQLQAGSFQPKGSEVNFSAETNTPGMALAVNPGITMKLHGRIDRMDLAQTEDTVYVKIIDYKSGSTVFDLTKLYYGLQLQLILYLSAALELAQKANPDKKAVPAGVYYYNIKNPVVEKPQTGQSAEALLEAVEASVLEELRMNGLSNASPDILQLLDHTEGKKSAVIKNLTRDASGAPAGTSLTATGTEMEQLCRYSKKKATDLCREMLSGEIPVNPYVYKDQTGCDYCAYKGICGFDPGVPGYRYRRLQPLTSEEVLTLIQEQEDN